MTLQSARNSSLSLRVIPFYTGDKTLDEVLKRPASINLLWIEILLNGDFPWEKYAQFPEVNTAYEKACVWYGHFKTMVDGHTGRSSLKPRTGEINDKEYRRFLEVLNFVSDYTENGH